MEFSPRFATSLIFLLAGLNAFGADGERRKFDPAAVAHCLTDGLGNAIAVARSRVNPRDEYIAQNLDKKFTTPGQNRRFIQIANDTPPGTNTIFIHNENSVLKKMNDSFQEKNFVTSMNNRYTEILLQQFQILEGRSPGLEIYIQQIDPYHDFKTSARAVTWKGEAPPHFSAQLTVAIQAADKEFTEELVNKKLLRKDDIDVGWYKTGTGDTADRASTAARVARILQQENRAVDFNEPWVKKLLNDRLAQTERARKDLETSLATRLPFDGIRGKATPSEQVFDLIRKSGGAPDVLLDALTKTFHNNSFNEDQAYRLIEYAKDVDRFSPSLRIEKREIISLDHAPHGGMSADFLGLGSSNLASVASALARSENLDQALTSSRQAEIEVTRQFKAKLTAFHEILGDIARCGGDDCVAMPRDHAFTEDEKIALVNRLAANPLTRKIRISFIDEGITTPGDRTKLATQGEDIEKLMRKSLLSRSFNLLTAKISARRMADFTIAIDMQTSKIFGGKVDMIIGAEPGKEPSNKELKQLRQALNDAVTELNRKNSSRVQSSRYRSVRKIYPLDASP